MLWASTDLADFAFGPNLAMPVTVCHDRKRRSTPKADSNQWLGLDGSTHARVPRQIELAVRVRRPCIAQFAQLQPKT